MAETAGGAVSDDFRASWTPEARTAALADPATSRIVPIDIPDFDISENRSRWQRITSFKILGKSVGDLAKEALTKEAIGYGALGALFRIGLGTAGWQGFVVAAGAGASVAAVREIGRQYSENQEANPDRIALKQKLKSLGPHDRIRLSKAILKGAVFGAAGGIIGEVIASPDFENVPILGGVKKMVGEAFSELGSKAHGVSSAVGEVVGTTGRWRESVFASLFGAGVSGEAQPAQVVTEPTKTPEPTKTATPVPTDAGKEFVDHSTYFKGRIEITDSSPEWIKSINRLDGTYSKVLQGSVGQYLSENREVLYNEVVRVSTQQGDGRFSSVEWLLTQNHIQHILEARANEVFDSYLQQLVSNGVDLNSISDQEFKTKIEEVGKEAFKKLLEEKGQDEIAKGIATVIQVHDEINQVIQAEPSLIRTTRAVPAGTSFFAQINQSIVTDTDLFKRLTPELAAMIAVNQDDLVHDAVVVELNKGQALGRYYEHFYYPAYLGELNYLMRLAEGGDLEAVTRIINAYKVISGSARELKFLTPEGVKRILEIIKRLG